MSFDRSAKEREVIRDIIISSSVMTVFIIGTTISLLMNYFISGGLVVRVLLGINTLVCLVPILFLVAILYESTRDLKRFYRQRRAAAFK